MHDTQNYCTIKPQAIHPMPNHALKDSNCDSPLSMIPIFTILALNASSISTNVLGFPHKKMILYSHKIVQQFKLPESHATTLML